MSLIMRYIGQWNCTKKDFSEESHLFFLKKNIFLVKNYGPVSALPLLYLNKKWNFMLDKKIISRCYPDGSF